MIIDFSDWTTADLLARRVTLLARLTDPSTPDDDYNDDLRDLDRTADELAFRCSVMMP